MENESLFIIPKLSTKGLVGWSDVAFIEDNDIYNRGNILGIFIQKKEYNTNEFRNFRIIIDLHYALYLEALHSIRRNRHMASSIVEVEKLTGTKLRMEIIMINNTINLTKFSGTLLILKNMYIENIQVPKLLIHIHLLLTCFINISL
jgi:hypothetical protein